MTATVRVDDLQRLANNLENTLLTAPSPAQYPVRLTPRSPYLTGRAALVFVGPHVLDPSGDLAEHGWADLDVNYGWLHSPPHEGARVVGWFRPTEAGRKYTVDFTCRGQPGHSFTLALSTGSTETVHVDTGNLQYPELADLREVLVGTTFEAQNENWKSFALSSDGHWKLESFEVVEHPA
jgi:hypothetical protein